MAESGVTHTTDRSLNSCLYEGSVRHRRFSPVDNSFKYSGSWLYLDLAELDDVFRGRWLWSTRRPAPFRFRREDHLSFPDDLDERSICLPSIAESSSESLGRKPHRDGTPLKPLDESIRDLVEASGAARPEGSIRLLTQPRYFGYVINPVSFYFCFDAGDSHVETVVAEVNNTPWSERHCYVLARDESEGRLRFRHQKRFHVSPFMELDMEYRWQIVEPGSTLTVHIENWQRGQHLFDCTFHLKRKPITGTSLAASLLKYPFMTGKITAGIYWQALRLWWKNCPFVPHPNSRKPAEVLQP